MNKQNYLAQLEDRCGKEAVFFYEFECTDGAPIAVIGFDDYPRAGEYTYFSYGLHLLEKEEWKYGKPEYFITINTDNREFAQFFAYLISAFSYEKVMSWNTLIGISDGDAVDGYPYRRIALGMPEYLDWPSYRIADDSELPINLGMAYFISNDDFDEAVEHGFSYLEMKMKDDYDYWRKIKRANKSSHSAH